MALIHRDVYLTKHPRIEPICIVRGSQIGIELEFKDYTIASGATAKAYARSTGAGAATYVANCSISGQVISFTPPVGFFVPGKNSLQVEVNGQIIPFTIDVQCEGRVSDAGEPATPTQVLPLVQRAETAATNAAASQTAVQTMQTEIARDYADIPGVKSDVSQLKEDIVNQSNRITEYDDGVFVYDVKWERGGIDTTTGADKTNNYRIRSNKIYFGSRDKVSIDLPSGYSLYFIAYDSENNVVGKNGWLTISNIKKSQYANTEYIRIMVQGETSTTLVPLDIAYDIKIYGTSTVEKRISALENTEIEIKTDCYVSVAGNDTNDGSFRTPFATVQHAIDNGFKNICVKNGVYFGQTVAADSVNDVRIYAYNGDAYTVAERSRPVFTNGVKYSSFNTDSNGYKYFALDSMPTNYKQVFINHSVDPVITGSYPSYRAQLWANHSNKYDDFRVKPVLTYADLSEANTFYYDGNNVYFNIASDIIGVTVGYDNTKMLSFTNCNNLHISGLEVYNAVSCNMEIIKSNNVTIDNCVFGYTMKSNGVSTDYSDVTFNNCESFKSCVDGFNAHNYGISTYNDCIASYNYDDGESSHEYCEIIVNGGEYSHNGKGGHSPVNGCKFKCNGSYAHHNKYGFYMIGGADYNRQPIIIGNSVAVNNTTKDIINTLYDTTLFNCKYNTTEIGSAGGTITDLTS